MAVVAPSAPKKHGFSIESLIGRRDDSPRRHSPHPVLSRPHDFSAPRDLVCRDPTRDRALRDADRDVRRVPETEDHTSLRDTGYRDSRDSVISPREAHRDSVHSPREAHRDHNRVSALIKDHTHPHFRDVYHRDSFKDSYRDNVRDSYRDGKDSVRDVYKEGARDGFRDSGLCRQGAGSPASGSEEDRPGGQRSPSRRSSSPASPLHPTNLSPRLEKASPELENRMGPWSNDDLKYLLGGSGAFHHQHPHHPPPGVEPGLYPPLRVSNRSLMLPPPFGTLHMNPLLMNLHRELAPHPATHPLLAARYPGFMHHRYPLGSPHPSMLFHPYRKPKRNRTAFSPSQLLQLEQAFEKNHYVVGQERKSLASKLQLTETQVKVWFQNRRTKHKRMKAEEEAAGGVTSGDEVAKRGDNCEDQLEVKSDVSDQDLMPADDICTSDEELSVTEDS